VIPIPVLSGGDVVRDTPGVSPIATAPPRPWEPRVERGLTKGSQTARAHGSLEVEQNPQPEPLEARVYGSRGRSLRSRDPPTRALGSQERNKVERRRVKEMHLKIALPRMSGVEKKI
jgi:hypothetical protein